MDIFINGFITKLQGKIPDEDLKIIKEQLEIFFKDYDVVKKETALAVTSEDILKELKEYLVSLKIEGLSDNTLYNYRLALKRFLCWLNKPVTEITANDIKYYLYVLKQDSGMKDISLNNQRTYICSYFSWLVDNDYIVKNPCRNIKPIKYEKHTRHSLTAMEMERLRAVCTTPRDKAIIEFLYATAARCEEMVNVKLIDLNYDRKEVILFGKGKKERVSYLNARAIVAIQRYLDTRGFEAPYLICSQKKPHGKLTRRQIENILKRLGEAAGVNVTPHLIRHTTATDAIDKGMPIEQAQKLLGHESISTTLIYAEARQENVKRGHEKFIV